MKMLSEFSPAGIIGAGKKPTSTILLEVILGDQPDDSRSFARLQAQVDQRACAKRTGPCSVWERPLVRFTLEVVQHEAELRFLDISKIHVGPVELKRLRFTSADLTPEQSTVVLSHLNLPESGIVKHDGTLTTLEMTGDNHRLQHVAEVRARLEKERDRSIAV